MDGQEERAGEPALGSIVVRVDGSEHAFTPADAPVVLGRESTCDVMVDNQNVSRRHAELQHDPGGWRVHDLDSRQGTFLDGEQVTDARLVRSHEISLGVVDVGKIVSVRVSGSETVDPLPAAPPPPAPEPERPARPAEGTIVTSGPRLRVECAGRTHDFGPSDVVVVGRSADSDVVATNQSVSRRHARLAHGPNGWQLEDLGSSGGTYVGGRRVDSPLPLSGTTEARLGAPDSGERLVVVAPGASSVIPPAGSSASKARRPKAWMVAAAAVLVAAVVAGVLLLTSGGSGPDLDQLARATVRLEVQTENGTITGSGTIIDAERGLILTNAHVAAPDAPGLAVLYEDPVVDQTPADDIVVEVASGLDEAAEPSFRAEVVAADGYLDVAVVQLTRRLSGALLEDGDLDGLEEVEIGDSEDISTGASLRILGYPSVSDSNAPNLTSGVVSSFIQDDRLETNRAFLNVDADISGGNSGGLAADDDGRIIGIPTLTRFSETDLAQANRIRPIGLVMPVIDAALAEEDYESPHVADLPDDATVEVFSNVAPAASQGYRLDCSSSGIPLESGVGAVAFAFDYAGFGGEGHQDLFFELFRRTSDGLALVGSATTASEFPVSFEEAGCAEVTIDLSEPLEEGNYRLFVWGGASYDNLLAIDLPVD